MSNLLEFITEVENMLLNYMQVDILYTDFRKAFDRLDHATIINSLVKINLPSNIISLIKSFLTHRENRVSYAGYISELFYPSSGVPQGSNLGLKLAVYYCCKYCSCLLELSYFDFCRRYKNICTYKQCIRLCEFSK